MKSEDLQKLTASEPLSLEEEYQMQQEWREDENSKLSHYAFLLSVIVLSIYWAHTLSVKTLIISLIPFFQFFIENLAYVNMCKM